MLSVRKLSWERIVGLVVITSLFVLAGFNWFLHEGTSDPSTIIVPDHYPSIQAAINNAADGDMIYVRNGTYHEHLVVNRTVSIVGENKEGTIVDGDGIGNVTLIVASNVSLTGFTIRNSSRSVYPNASAGLVLRDSDSCTIHGNNLVDNYYGVWASNSPHCNFSSNLMASNGEDGIVLQFCPYSSVAGNNVSYNDEAGIVLRSQTNYSIVSENVVVGNKGVDNDGHGIWLIGASFNTIRDNNVTGNNVIGIYLCNSSSDNNLTDNTISSNTINNIRLNINCHCNVVCHNIVARCGLSGDAIWIGQSSNNTFDGNDVIDNRRGFWVTHASYNQIRSNNIIRSINMSQDLGRAIWLDFANFNHIQDNNVIRNNVGVGFTSSYNNTIHHNELVVCRESGLHFELGSQFNIITDNNISGNPTGILFDNANPNNEFLHNSIVNNTRALLDGTGGWSTYVNKWDCGYPEGGNHWGSYNCTDAFQGFGQNMSGSDGIADLPRSLYKANQDNYPLMGDFHNFSATQDESVQIISNSSIFGFSFNGSALTAQISGNNGSTGFCRFCIPVALITSPFKTYVDGTEVENRMLPCSNSTHSYLYFEYAHPALEMDVTRSSFANFTWVPTAPHFNETVIFDASTSLPSAGNISSYVWDFGDGVNATLTTPEASHVYSEEGNYTVALNVTDSEGYWDTEEVVIPVLPACGPTADFTWLPSQVHVNNTVTFNASTSSPGWDGTCYLPITTYLWDFGDGNLTASGSETIAHVYSTEGNCTVTLTIFDTSNSSDVLELQLVVLSSRIPGDVNGDGIVNMLDLYKIALNYGKTAPYETPEIANCDVDNNGIINMLDLYIAAVHYGQTGP